MKKLALFVTALCLGFCVFAQIKPYDENLDAVKQIKDAVLQAKSENKYVLAQVGGNWCPWCLKFAEFAKTNQPVKQIIDKNFVYIHVNWSKNNKNPEAMKMLGNPTRFGFPVFVILDENGNRIHTQNSAYLEEDKGYSEKKVVEFLINWTKEAVNTVKR